ncbi:MAG: CobD/CbiB family cobalamin biosynthesis protein [Cyanobium sp.]
MGGASPALAWEILWGPAPWGFQAAVSASSLTRGLIAAALVVAACALDRWLGDPQGWPHPVQAMGALIAVLRQGAEAWAGDRPTRLRLAGSAIALVVLAASGLAGWAVERLALVRPGLGGGLLLAGLASALAGGSLERAVEEVLVALGPARPGPAGQGPWQDGAAGPGGAGASLEAEPRAPGGAGLVPKAAVLSHPFSDAELEPARQRLAWIVGRDVAGLDEPEILRALAETASENGVDGLFAPLFWMLGGAALWTLVPGALAPFCPGPLCLAWLFKAASTMDSMLGYRHGKLRWLGTAGARLDDVLTWLPCRLVALSLALEPPPPGSPGVGHGPRWRFHQALREGAADPSPNAGVSQAAYALAAGVRLGGVNVYGGVAKAKPVLAAAAAPADRDAVRRILNLNRRLELVWLVMILTTLLLTAEWS